MEGTAWYWYVSRDWQYNDKGFSISLSQVDQTQTAAGDVIVGDALSGFWQRPREYHTQNKTEAIRKIIEVLTQRRDAIDAQIFRLLAGEEV